MRPTLLLIAALLLLVGAGCGSASPTPASERPPATTVDESPSPVEDNTDFDAEEYGYEQPPAPSESSDYYDSEPEVDGTAEMQKLYDQELEAQMDETCAREPSAPFC